MNFFDQLFIHHCTQFIENTLYCFCFGCSCWGWSPYLSSVNSSLKSWLWKYYFKNISLDRDEIYIIYIFRLYIVCLKLPYLTLYKHRPLELDPPLRQGRNLVWDLFQQYQALQDIEQNLDILLLLGFPRLEKRFELFKNQ